jgi:glycosyltransferase involved in cell wall biosynthesis
MISVVVSTYNSPDRLEKVLWGYSVQTEKRFELIVADDGSIDETCRLIDRIRDETGMDIHHVWHEDIGFRKTRICNQAFLKARFDYILCADGDCIPRADLLETHLRYARPGRFLCGTAIRISKAVCEDIDREAIVSGNAFRVQWLTQHGMRLNRYLIRMTYPRWFQPIANRFLCSNPRFNGGNSSAWKSDILRVPLLTPTNIQT